MNKYKGCNYCVHFRGDGTCAAFDPEIIPIFIADGQVKHTKPLKTQKNNIVYEYTDKHIAYRITIG